MSGSETAPTLQELLEIVSLVAVSKHISVLERAGLLARVRSGRAQVCTLAAEPMAEAVGWLQSYQRFWSTRLSSLERYLESED